MGRFTSHHFTIYMYISQHVFAYVFNRHTMFNDSTLHPHVIMYGIIEKLQSYWRALEHCKSPDPLSCRCKGLATREHMHVPGILALL